MRPIRSAMRRLIGAVFAGKGYSNPPNFAHVYVDCLTVARRRFRRSLLDN
jgi:hypothetical protein